MQSFAVTDDLPIARPKTREQAAYEILREAIVAGRWAPGTPLVGSRLADDLGVSRITIANALKRLAGEGFVETTAHKGAVVARLDPDAVREIYLMRGALEALAAREAAGRIQSEDLDRLHARNGEIAAADEAGADIREVRQLDRRFHDELRALSGMPTLARTLRNLADQCEGYRARLLDSSALVRPSGRRHDSLLDALERHDGETAGAAMQTHIIEGLDALLLVIDQQPGDAGSRSGSRGR